MPIKVPDVAERQILLNLREAFQNYLTIRLYKNDLTPDDSTTLVDFEEADFEGYSGAGLSLGTVLGTNPDGLAVMEFDTIQWIHPGGGSSSLVYGYWITDQSSELVWCERFPNAPYTMAITGDTLAVTPRIKLRSIN